MLPANQQIHFSFHFQLIGSACQVRVAKEAIVGLVAVVGCLVGMFCGSTLRVPPAYTRLTVYRWLQILLEE